jgi:hypothetical protein
MSDAQAADAEAADWRARGWLDAVLVLGILNIVIAVSSAQ